jgi:hypothetical protein
MSRFGPSGSLKKKNSALENTMAVIPKISIETFFDNNIQIYLCYLRAELSSLQSDLNASLGSLASATHHRTRAARRYTAQQLLHHPDPNNFFA